MKTQPHSDDDIALFARDNNRDSECDELPPSRIYGSPLVRLSDDVDGSEVINSTQLYNWIYGNTGDHTHISKFLQAVRSSLSTITPDVWENATYGNDGYLLHFNLTEVQCNVVLSYIDNTHRHAQAKAFVEAQETPWSGLVLHNRPNSYMFRY